MVKEDSTKTEMISKNGLYGNITINNDVFQTMEIHRTHSGVVTTPPQTTEPDSTYHRRQRLFEQLGIGNHSFCRNPTDKDYAWCYTDDGVAYCDIGVRGEYCDGPLPTDPTTSTIKPTGRAIDHSPTTKQRSTRLPRVFTSKQATSKRIVMKQRTTEMYDDYGFDKVNVGLYAIVPGIVLIFVFIIILYKISPGELDGSEQDEDDENDLNYAIEGESLTKEQRRYIAQERALREFSL
ncbi:uncharacterized protein LOC102800737 [Saccoglossus kowalevskii]